jgi:hypothetical protein
MISFLLLIEYIWPAAVVAGFVTAAALTFGYDPQKYD